MGSHELQPETPEEHLIWWTIVGTWGFWLLGALYVVGPVLGYGLLALAAARWLGVIGDDGPVSIPMPAGALVWAIGMLALALALVVAHLDYELGVLQTLKSFIGWMKGWALLAVFVVAGATLSIRPHVIYRATGIFGLQTLLLAPIFLLAGMVGLPAVLYVSPLSMVGGPGPEFFDVSLYHIDDTNGLLRWRFFAPWSTAAAFVAGIGFIFALYERSVLWKTIGIVSAIVVCWMAGSRLSMVALPAIVVGVLVISNVLRPMVLLLAAFLVAAFALMNEDIIMAVNDIHEAFTQARAASSRVRAALASIAYHRWATEAPVWGHGILERGPHLVQFMPIGSHHTWNGLLFVKGAVGFLGLAIPLGWSAVELALKAQADRVARAGLAVMLALLLFSFGDNLEIVAYLIWPGMLVVGIAMRRAFRSPLGARLGA